VRRREKNVQTPGRASLCASQPQRRAGNSRIGLHVAHYGRAARRSTFFGSRPARDHEGTTCDSDMTSVWPTIRPEAGRRISARGVCRARRLLGNASSLLVSDIRTEKFGRLPNRGTAVFPESPLFSRDPGPIELESAGSFRVRSSILQSNGLAGHFGAN
jgi:hypothetical protein